MKCKDKIEEFGLAERVVLDNKWKAQGGEIVPLATEKLTEYELRKIKQEDADTRKIKDKVAEAEKYRRFCWAWLVSSVFLLPLLTVTPGLWSALESAEHWEEAPGESLPGIYAFFNGVGIAGAGATLLAGVISAFCLNDAKIRARKHYRELREHYIEIGRTE